MEGSATDDIQGCNIFDNR